MRRLPRSLRPLLLFAPSLAIGLVGGVWLLLRPLRLEAQAGPLGIALATALLLAGLLGAGWLLERTLPSFRHAGRLLERALQHLPVTLPLALGLALATSVAEELFFRGALLGWIGVWPQALLFGLLHPATRRGWSYTLFTFVAGLAFGYATLWTGSLWAAIAAHFVINLQGFLEIRARQRRRRARWAAYATGVERTAERAVGGLSSTVGTAGPPIPDPSPPSDDLPADRTRVGAEPPATGAQPESPDSPSDDASPESPGSSAPPPREPPAP